MRIAFQRIVGASRARSLPCEYRCTEQDRHSQKRDPRCHPLPEGAIKALDHIAEGKRRPLQLAEMSSKLDVFVNASGGGFTGQAGAICQGIARALKDMFGAPTEQPEDGEATGGMAKKLRDSGFLTRDGRMKERKKYGRKGARKSFQFSKR